MWSQDVASTFTYYILHMHTPSLSQTKLHFLEVTLQLKTESVLTVRIDISQFIVQIKKTSNAVLNRRYWSISSQNVFVKLKMWR